MRKIIFTDPERDIFTRREHIPVAPWASKSLIVQDGVYKGSALRLDVAPFLAGPMNAFSAPGVREVAVCGSLQVGKTLFLYACLAWAMVFRPGIKMLAMPTKESRNRVVEKKLKPLLRGSPALRRRLGRFKLDTILLRDGTSIELPTAESPSGRASITVQDLIVDEEDLYGAGGSSNPLDDFRGRTRSYGDLAKIARACQPKGGEESSIWRGVTRDADQLYCYEVRCPSELCGHWHRPDLEHLVVPGGEKDPRLIRAGKLARYRCPRCKWEWTDHLRDLAVAGGRWRPYRYSAERGFEPVPDPPVNLLPEHWGPDMFPEGEAGPSAGPPAAPGFHIPAILSRFVSLSDLAARREIARASDEPEVVRQFYNDDLALPYTPVAVSTDAEKLLELREAWLPPMVAPHGTVVLTCGIDVQKHGFWFMVRAWMPNLSSYIIDYGQLGTWEEVYRQVFETAYPVMGPTGLPGFAPGASTGMEREAYLAGMLEACQGEVMPIWRAGIDSGGTETEGVYTRTEEVYLWVRSNGGSTAFACKGASREQATPVRWIVRERMPHNGRPIPGGLRLYMLDVTNLKTQEFSRLLNPESRQPTRFHSGADTTLTGQLSAERLVRKGNRNVWEVVRQHNHLLDCLVLSGAVADAAWTPSLPHYLLQLKAQERAANQPAPERKKRQRPVKTSRW